MDTLALICQHLEDGGKTDDPTIKALVENFNERKQDLEIKLENEQVLDLNLSKSCFKEELELELASVALELAEYALLVLEDKPVRGVWDGKINKEDIEWEEFGVALVSCKYKPTSKMLTFEQGALLRIIDKEKRQRILQRQKLALRLGISVVGTGSPLLSPTSRKQAWLSPIASPLTAMPQPSPSYLPSFLSPTHARQRSGASRTDLNNSDESDTDTGSSKPADDESSSSSEEDPDFEYSENDDDEEDDQMVGGKKLFAEVWELHPPKHRKRGLISEATLERQDKLSNIHYYFKKVLLPRINNEMMESYTVWCEQRFAPGERASHTEDFRRKMHARVCVERLDLQHFRSVESLRKWRSFLISDREQKKQIFQLLFERKEECGMKRYSLEDSLRKLPGQLVSELDTVAAANIKKVLDSHTPSKQDRKKLLRQLNERGQSCLHLACERGYVSTVKLLLQGGASVAMTDDCGFSPFHAAAAAGMVQVLDVLLEHHAWLRAHKHSKSRLGPDLHRRQSFTNLLKKVEALVPHEKPWRRD